MRSYFDGMLRYFEFSGRSTRMQYWMFFVVQVLLTGLAVAIDYQMGGFADPRNIQVPMTLFITFVHIVPGVTVQVRRLHDIGRSGAWYLLHFVPFGGLVLLYWACCDSEAGSNYYDSPAPSSYAPRSAALASAPRQSTIPRQVRMGSNAARPPSMGHAGLAEPQRFI
jgi:uncharacterized membrane protein YhaH (DUF805 family)